MNKGIRYGAFPIDLHKTPACMNFPREKNFLYGDFFISSPTKAGSIFDSFNALFLCFFLLKIGS